MNKNKKFYLACLILGLAIVICMLVGCSLGTSDQSLSKIILMLQQVMTNQLSSDNQTLKDIFFEVRLPKVLLALVVGIALGSSGVSMQAIVKNPLADPYILGISSGASLGATLAIMLGLNFGFGNIIVGMCAFIFAILSALLILVIAGKGYNNNNQLILAGIALGSLSGAVSNLIIYLSNDSNATQQLVFWTMGSLNNANYSLIAFLSVVVVLALIFLQAHYKILDLMLLGDESALTLGFKLSKYRLRLIIIVSLLTGLVVFACGIIPFVGLVVPHIMRYFVGNKHQYLLPLSALGGALFLLLADILSRTLISYTQIPIGILISCVGAPIFVFTIIQKGRSK